MFSDWRRNAGFAQQTGKAALDSLIGDNRVPGVTLNYGSVEEIGDTLVINDFDMSYQTSFQFGTDEGKQSAANIEFSMNAPEVVATKLADEADGVSVEHLKYSADIDFKLDVEVDGDTVLTYQGTIEDYQLSGFFWPYLPAVPSTLKGSTREWVVWLGSLADIRIDAASANLMTVRFSAMEESGVESAFSSDVEISDFKLEGMWDGRVASYSVGKMLQETNYSLEDGQQYSEKVTIDSNKAKNLDYLAFLDLFDPKPAGSSEYVQVIESAVISGCRVESNLFEAIIDRISYENFAVRSPETDLIAFVELLLSGQEPEIGDLMATVLDIYRSFSFGNISVEDFLVGFDADTEVGSGGIVKISFSGFSSDGLDEFLLEAVDFDAGAGGSSGWTDLRWVIWSLPLTGRSRRLRGTARPGKIRISWKLPEFSRRFPSAWSLGGWLSHRRSCPATSR
ncbi:MAG: hypothetical protein GY789_16955 [Hyphomicrobiales bacterium]|nr:hypothetical protein [Hyphomicrobiales bacterium]MCP5001053.1 hypothetical protein [Hyphomicrobiales bacterium]